MSDAHDEIRVDTPALRAAVRAGAITEDEAILLAEIRRQGVCVRHELAQLAGSRGLRRRLAALRGGERSAVADTETVQAARARLERNVRIMDRVRLAEEPGDLDEADRLWATQLLSARALARIKEIAGAAWIRARGLDTRLADAEFGPGWLDEP